MEGRRITIFQAPRGYAKTIKVVKAMRENKEAIMICHPASLKRLREEYPDIADRIRSPKSEQSKVVYTEAEKKMLRIEADRIIRKYFGRFTL